MFVVRNDLKFVKDIISLGNFIFEIWSNDCMFNTLVMLRNMFDNIQMLDMKDRKLGPADRRRDWNFR